MKRAGIFIFAVTLGANFALLSAARADTDDQAFCNSLDSKYGNLENLSSSDAEEALSNDDCVKKSNVADQCCGNPMSCVANWHPDGNASEGASMGAEILQIVSGVALSVPGTISAMCGRMQAVADVTIAINTGLALRCRNYVMQCKSSCVPKSQQANSDFIHAQAVCRSQDQVRGLSYINGVYQQKISQCNGSSTADFAMVQQTVGSVLAQKFSNMCKEQANMAQVNTFNTPNCFDPQAAGSPFCQFACDRPGAASSPNCAAIVASLSSGASGFGAGSSGFSAMSKLANSKSMFDDAPVAPEPNQTPVVNNGPPINLGLAKTEGGRPSGGLGEGGAPMQGMGTAPTGNGRGGGYDTSILRGVTAGGGYSVGKVGLSNSGGYSGAGYGGPMALRENFGHKFSLKDFLPGGKNGPKQEPFRGLASTVADIAPAHDDIFQKVTNRFYQVCLRDGLYDCATLKKKTKGN